MHGDNQNVIKAAQLISDKGMDHEVLKRVCQGYP